jgi:hypothetical protein
MVPPVIHARSVLLFPLVALLCAGPAAHAAELDEKGDIVEHGDDDEQAHDEGRWGINVVPRFMLSSDNGFGLGVRGTAFWHRWGEKPYKTAVSFQAFATTRFVQHHFLRVDAIDAFNVPLRITAEAGYFQTLTFNYCGLGGAAVCDEGAAERAGLSRSLAGDELEAFTRRYHQVRFLRPYLNGVFRWRLAKKPHKPELIAGWRGHYYQPGDFVDEDGDGQMDLFPYPGSQYDDDTGGERGFASVFQLGASIDDRDHEPDPSRGYFVESSIRGATPFWGSAWSFFGSHTTARLFVPLMKERRLVLATRYAADVILGDAPIMELARMGGSQDYFALGGDAALRGVRQQLYPGRLKVLAQHELRSALVSFSFLEQDFRLGGALFVDAGLSLTDAARIRHDEVRLRTGFGLGVRLVWNDNFVMRVDAGISASEGWVPYLYTLPDHPY